jgi:hypothetical protein
MAPISGSVQLSVDMLLFDEPHTNFELKEYLTDAECAESFYIDSYDYFDSLFDMVINLKDFDGFQHW